MLLCCRDVVGDVLLCCIVCFVCSRLYCYGIRGLCVPVFCFVVPAGLYVFFCFACVFSRLSIMCLGTSVVAQFGCCVCQLLLLFVFVVCVCVLWDLMLIVFPLFGKSCCVCPCVVCCCHVW